MSAKSVIWFLLSFTCVLSSVIIDAGPQNIPDENRQVFKDNKPQLGSFNLVNFLEKHGFPLEEHKVKSKIIYYYNLLVHRIPNGRFDNETKQRPVVVMAHGLSCSAVEFLTAGPERSLAMQLADEGYDVWLINARGNTYSRDHSSLDPDRDEKFWQFSFHEIATEDFPAIIKYIIRTTKVDKVNFIGYSIGNTEAFAMLAERPELNDKINLLTALAPVVYTKNMASPVVRFLANNLQIIQVILKQLKVNELLSHSALISGVLSILCSPDLGLPEICPFIIYLTVGFDSEQLNKDYIPQFLQTYPAGTSTNTMLHVAQMIKTGKFAKMDFGIMGNMEKYEQPAPAEYDLTKITAPVALFYGENDWLVAVKDVDDLEKALVNSTQVYKNMISYKYFNHFDFLAALDITELVNNDVINLINSYNGKEPLSTTSTPESTTTEDDEPISTTPTSSAVTVASISSTTCFLLNIILISSFY